MTKSRDNQIKANKVVPHRHDKYTASKNAKKLRVRAIARKRLDSYDEEEVFEDEDYSATCTSIVQKIKHVEEDIKEEHEDYGEIDAAFDYLVQTVFNFVLS